MLRLIQSLLLTGLLCKLLFGTVLFAAPDEQATEQTPAQTDANAIMIKQPAEIADYLSLNVGEEHVAATFTTDRTGDNHGGILLLANDSSINGAGSIANLKQYLPNHGWTVMTVALKYAYQPNILLSKPQEKIDIDIAADATASADDTSATATDAVETEKAATEDKPEQPDPHSENLNRIQSAVTYLRQQDMPYIIIIAEGRAAEEAFSCFKADKKIADALISLGAGVTLSEFTEFPDDVVMLEILPSGEGLQQINQRKAEMKRLGKKYQQRLIPAQDLNFYAYQPPLLSTVDGWLYKTFVKQAEN